MKILNVLAAAIILLGSEASTRVSGLLAAQGMPSGTCPPSDHRDAAIMRKLFASDSRTAGRGRAENARLAGASVRPLRAETDQVVCSRLNEIFTAAEDSSVSHSYYAFETYYIVVARRQRNPRVFSTAFVPVVIFDRELKAVEILAI